MILYGISTCDTCRAALKALRAAGRDVTFHDIRTTPLPEADLARFYAVLGDSLINRASTTWRGLDEADRNLPPLQLLTRHPTLMKRPVIEAGTKLYLGWAATTQAVVLG